MNWTTFVLEIINFLVLVWLLKHFLYQPVKAVIERRRSEIAEQLQQTEEERRQVDAMREQYENRIADWEGEREAARRTLQRELEAERQRQLAALRSELDSEREKAAVLAERQQQEQQRQNEMQALEQGARFAARLLEAVASPAVQDRLFEHLLGELEHLPPAQRDALQKAVERGKPVPVQVLSAFPLSSDQQQQLQQQLNACLPQHGQYEFNEERKLVAGLRLIVGPWVLHANLNDELKAFAAMAHEQTS